MEISRPSEAYIRPVESETVHLLPCTMYSAMFTKFPNQLLSRAKTNQFTVSQTHTHTQTQPRCKHPYLRQSRGSRSTP